MPDATAATVTSFEYRYRDASNYKVTSRILLSGRLSGEERALILNRLQDGEFFIAEQVGIPPLYQSLFELSGGPNEDDHGWHEFVAFSDEGPAATSMLWGSVEELATRFTCVAHWDLGLSELSSD